MVYKTTQKIIRIGSSKGNTLPVKLLDSMDLDVGDEVELTIKKLPVKSDDTLLLDKAKSILDRYEQDFKHLAQR